MNKEKALKNQGLEFREDISIGGGTTRISNIRGDWHCCQKRESQDHA